MAIKKVFFTAANPESSTLALDMKRSWEWQGIVVFNMEGLGPPKATVSGLGGPNLHGTTVNSIKVDARHIMLTLAVVAHQNFDEEDVRQEIYTHFPISKEINFRVQTDGPKDLQITAIVESVEMNQFAKVENAVISLYCPDPYWSALSEITQTVPDGGPDLISYGGEVATGCTVVITLEADVSSKITITRQHGYAATETLTVSTSIVAAQAGVTLAASDRIEVNTIVGQKSCMFWDNSLAQWHNVFQAVDIDDDWLEILVGANTMGWSCATPAEESDMTIDIKYTPLWEGV